MLKVKQFVFNPVEVNTFVVYDSDTLDALVIDPGMLESHEHEEFDKFITDNHLKVQQIVNTHLHFDHCFGDNYVRSRYGVKVAASVGDDFLGKNLANQARSFHIPTTSETSSVEIDIKLSEGDRIKVGNYEFVVIEVPGHSQGSIALYCRTAGIVFVGDALFRGSIGRTDLAGGDYATLIRNIREKLLTLPEATIVAPGHNGPTTIGEEKKNNPYL